MVKALSTAQKVVWPNPSLAKLSRLGKTLNLLSKIKSLSSLEQSVLHIISIIMSVKICLHFYAMKSMCPRMSKNGSTRKLILEVNM